MSYELYRLDDNTWKLRILGILLDFTFPDFPIFFFLDYLVDRFCGRLAVNQGVLQRYDTIQLFCWHMGFGKGKQFGATGNFIILRRRRVNSALTGIAHDVQGQA